MKSVRELILSRAYTRNDAWEVVGHKAYLAVSVMQPMLEEIREIEYAVETELFGGPVSYLAIDNHEDGEFA